MYDKITVHLPPIACQGRFKAIKHTGHTFNEFGEVIKWGDVIEETGFGPNKITLTGFATMLTPVAQAGFTMVAGTSNTTPTEGDTTLTAYAGRASTNISAVTTRSTTPDGSGNVFWRQTYRQLFNPGAFGASPVNLAEAGVVTRTDMGSVGSSSLVDCHGLLVDGGGSPVAVTVAPDEYFDLIWEYTEYIKASVTGLSCTITVLGTPTSTTCEVRPCNFGNTGGSYNYKGWQNITWTLPVTQYQSGAGLYRDKDAGNQVRYGALAAITSMPNYPAAGNGVGYVCTSYVLDAYVSGSKNLTGTMSWSPIVGNVTDGDGGTGSPANVAAFILALWHSQWQISYSPTIAKNDSRSLDLSFSLTMANL